MTYRFLSPVPTEISAAAEFYEEKVPGLGAEFLQEVEATIARILDFPNAWGRLSGYYRHCSLRRFPYTIIYALEGQDSVVIISLFHQSRDLRFMEARSLSDPESTHNFVWQLALTKRFSCTDALDRPTRT